MSGYRRVREPSRIWHVMSRGVRQTPLFLTEEDHRTFLRILRHTLESTEMTLLSGCLMPNHHHLELEGKGESLSQCMKQLNSGYSREFNKRIGSSGHLFQGPYRAYRAKHAPWVVDRATYIHLNPVEAGLVRDPLEYPWSTLRDYLGGKSAFPEVRADRVLAAMGRNAREKYREHIRYRTQQCLANRPLVDSVIKSCADRRVLPPELIRIQAHDLRALLDASETVLNESPVPLMERQRLLMMVVCHLALEWRLAELPVIAAILGCSMAAARLHRKRALRWMETTARFRDLIPRIRRELTVHGPKSTSPNATRIAL